MVMGLIEPTSGEVLFDGQPITGLAPRKLRHLRRRLQIVFQDPYAALNPRMRVQDIVAEPLIIHRTCPRSGLRAKVSELLRAAGLDDSAMPRYPHEFSGGQRQRIGIARGLALRPEIIVADEPVSALDVSVQAQVINLMARLQREFGLSYVFIAHDLSIVRHISDRVGVMYLGRMVETGGDAEIYEHPTHPYTQALLSAVPVPDPRARAHRERIILTGDVPSPTQVPSGCRFRTRCFKARERCAEEVPVLAVPEPLRAAGGPAAHPSACHFAEEKRVVAAEARP
jgi:oligopeptide transport system ATP-binding protein